jgi:predicted deacetylase
MRGARYLLRFDDLCPTMNWMVWDEIEGLLDKYSIQPILAIVPDNHDPKLRIEAPNPRFWERARAWQVKGWIIGQHGYTHIYDSASPGIVRWWNQSEFAGHPYAVQYSRVSEGLKSLRAHGLSPILWIAPSHSFDQITLQVLGEVGIRIISDGVSFRPYRDHRGLIWIPLQPWKPWVLDFGYWSVCQHHNTLATVEYLTQFVEANYRRIMGVEFTFADLITDARPCGFADMVFENLYWTLFLGRRRVVGLARAAHRRLRLGANNR